MGFLDPAKASAKPAIKSLQQHGVAVKVLTGDNAIVAQKVCQDVGIPADQYVLGNQIDEMSDDELYQAAETTNLFAKLNPMQKSRIIEALQNKGHTVGFMGDGINDAPVLSRVDVGIAMGALGSDAAIEAADIVLMDDDPLKIVKAIRISKKCMRIVYENIYFAIGIKILCLILGAVGIANMWLAIFADVGVMVIAVLNAIRVLFVKKL